MRTLKTRLPCPRVLTAARALFGVVCGSALLSTPVSAAESARAVVVKDERGQAVVTAVLESESSALRRDERFRLGTHLTMADGWHVYWTNPGDAGMATKLTFSSTDVATGEHAFPAPEVFTSSAGEVVSFGYGRELTILSEAEVLSLDASARTVTIDAKLSLLACKDICIKGKASLSITLPLVDDTRTHAVKGGDRGIETTKDLAMSARFDDATRRVPRALTCTVHAFSTTGGAKLLLQGCAAPRAPFFVPRTESDALRAHRVDSDGSLALTLLDAARKPARVSGVLYLADGAFLVDVPLTDGSSDKKK